LCTALSWLVKQDAVMLPVVISAIVIVVWPATIPTIPVKRRIAVVVASLLILIVVLILQRQSIGAVTKTSQANQALMTAGFDKTLPVKSFVLTSIRAFTTYYLWRMIVPIGLSVDPEVETVTAPFDAGFLVSTTLLVALAVVALWMYKRQAV